MLLMVTSLNHIEPRQYVYLKILKQPSESESSSHWAIIVKNVRSIRPGVILFHAVGDMSNLTFIPTSKSKEDFDNEQKYIGDVVSLIMVGGDSP
jgi:hypothetical protein